MGHIDMSGDDIAKQYRDVLRAYSEGISVSLARSSETAAAAGIVLSWCNTEAKGLHLAEIAAKIKPIGCCALLSTRQDGTHAATL
jgi:hypothetical protein